MSTKLEPAVIEAALRLAASVASGLELDDPRLLATAREDSGFAAAIRVNDDQAIVALVTKEHDTWRPMKLQQGVLLKGRGLLASGAGRWPGAEAPTWHWVFGRIEGDLRHPVMVRPGVRQPLEVGREGCFLGLHREPRASLHIETIQIDYDIDEAPGHT
ncbi:MAG: hypothetical protein ACRDT6_00435 [Micromonosporaceae bacterium]